jgi:hypothetical protein
MDFKPIKLLTDQFEKLITEHGSAAILRDHLALFRDQIKLLGEKIETLEKENARLKTDLTEANIKLAAYAAKDEFVENRGFLFKRKREGGYALCVYCPKCKTPMGGGVLSSSFPFQCGTCGAMTNFSAGELDNIIRELPK